jgi:CelD/BcsL family acetyltransferase involved in cellulose biosynthesis
MIMAVRSTPSDDPCGALAQDPVSDPSAAGKSPRYRIEPVTTQDGLSSLAADWNSLSKTTELPNVFTTFDWFRAWNERATRDDQRECRRANVLVLRRDGAVAGISPLIRRTVSRFGLVVRKVEFLESPADYNDMLLGDDPARQIQEVINYLRQIQDQWDIVDLRYLRDVGHTMALIESALSKTDLMYRIMPEARCPYLPIDANWPQILNQLSSTGRRPAMGLHTLRKKQHRLERMNAQGLRVRIIEDPQNDPGLLDKLITLENQKRIRGESVRPFFAQYPEVFQSLFETLGPRDLMFVGLMELGDRPLACQLGFRCGKKLWAFFKAHDHSFTRFSPGTMLFLAILEYGFSNSYQEYDSLRGEYTHKLTWSIGSHETFRLAIWNRRWTSRIRALLYLDFRAVGRILRACLSVFSGR